MDRAEAIKVLQTEVACVKRDDCARIECAKCDLVLEQSDILTAYAMAIAALREQDTLKRLVMGEWVDCEEVQKALGIDFATGLKMFDFDRTAEWNPAPLNGQKITTKFRLKMGGVNNG